MVKTQDLRLFFGLRVNSDFETALNSVDAKLAAIFIRNDSEDYLQEIAQDGCRFIGKFTSEIASIKELKLLESNIVSLLHRIVPNCSLESGSLLLFPYKYPLK